MSTLCDKPPARPAPMTEAHPAASGSPARGSPKRKPVPKLDAGHPFSSATATHSPIDSIHEMAPPLLVRTVDLLTESPPLPPPRRVKAPSPVEIIPLQPQYSNDSLASLGEAFFATGGYRRDRKMSEVEWAHILDNRPDPLNKPLPDYPRLESMDTLRFQRASSSAQSVRLSDASSAPPLTPEPTQDQVTWDVAREIDFENEEDIRGMKPTWASSAPGSPLRAYGKGKKSLSGVPKETFDVSAIPSKQRLWEAGTCLLKDEEGSSIRFSELFASPLQAKKKTVVFFIRHFWCGQCQDYMFASLSLLDPSAMAEAGVNVVIISNGSWKIIKKYRELFKCPFPVYVDGPRRLYQLMGMTKMTNDFGPSKDRAAYHQRAVPGQLVHGIGNALFKMPIRDPGTLTQLGGEFVLGPGWQCSFAHRMSNTSDHMEAPDVLKMAGCVAPTFDEHAKAVLEAIKREEELQQQKETEEWREGRVTELERIRRCKAERRGQAFVPDTSEDLDARFRAIMLQDTIIAEEQAIEMQAARREVTVTM